MTLGHEPVRKMGATHSHVLPNQTAPYQDELTSVYSYNSIGPRHLKSQESIQRQLVQITGDKAVP